MELSLGSSSASRFSALLVAKGYRTCPIVSQDISLPNAITSFVYPGELFRIPDLGSMIRGCLSRMPDL
jgi:hypothetical protein